MKIFLCIHFSYQILRTKVPLTRVRFPRTSFFPSAVPLGRMNRSPTPQPHSPSEDLPNLSSFPVKRAFIPTDIPTDVIPSALRPAPDYDAHRHARELSAAMDLIPDVQFPLPGYRPARPATVPDSFPQFPDLRLLQPELLHLTDDQTLFFVFYFHQSTPAQFHAGRELSARGWIFHRVQRRWFRRLSEPVERTDEYEIAKFESFACERSEWGLRMHNTFRLNYTDVD